MRSRYYNPEWGRFINADGLVGKTGELQSYNMFGYCKNNPINMNDPSGYLPKWLSNALTVVSGVLTIVAGVAIGSTIPILGALIMAHGANLIASGLTDDKYNWEKQALGEHGYLIYDTAIGLTTLGYSFSNLNNVGIGNTYVNTTTTAIRTSKGVVEKTINVNLHWGKVGTDFVDYGVGTYGQVTNARQIVKYIKRESSGTIIKSSRGINFAMSY